MKIIGIVGTRRKDTYAHYLMVKEEFEKHYEPGDMICSGLCPKGADFFALAIALGLENYPNPSERYYLYRDAKEGKQQYKIPVKWYPALWEAYGRAAGFMRNTHIATISDVLIALVSDDRTGGTEDTVKKFINFHGQDNLFLLS